MYPDDMTYEEALVYLANQQAFLLTEAARRREAEQAATYTWVAEPILEPDYFKITASVVD